MTQHIRQKNSSKLDDFTYTVVNTENYQGTLSKHPSLLEHPEIFELVDDSLPDEYNILNYQ